MKLSLYTVGALALVSTTFATGLNIFNREQQQPTMEDVQSAIARIRKLDGNEEDDVSVNEFLSFFLVSRISQNKAWCITASEGTKEFGNIKLEPCDFLGAPANQRWFLNVPHEDLLPLDDENFKIRSALDDTKCLTVNHGTTIFDGARTRLSDCDNGLNVFYDTNQGQIRVEEDDAYCLTNRGPNPHKGDWIHTKNCIKRKDFLWDLVPHVAFRIQLTSGGGCAQAREGCHRVFLDECDEDLAWYIWFVLVEEYFEQEHVLLRSPFDQDKCLRAGTGASMRDGTRMAVFDCDAADPLQHFIYDGSVIHAAYNYDLCMVYRGTTPNVGVDPIIMKRCNDNQEGWEDIDVSPF